MGENLCTLGWAEISDANETARAQNDKIKVDKLYLAKILNFALRKLNLKKYLWKTGGK